ncbi:hypothetical protein DRN86_00765 [Candidatus Geothermarchaeota archaeon]|nr:MAG: hypothetical protein DRN86_00765 [Candidatus Geothermarchaeota archaeon]
MLKFIYSMLSLILTALLLLNYLEKEEKRINHDLLIRKESFFDFNKWTCSIKVLDSPPPL